MLKQWLVSVWWRAVWLVTAVRPAQHAYRIYRERDIPDCWGNTLNEAMDVVRTRWEKIAPTWTRRSYKQRLSDWLQVDGRRYQHFATNLLTTRYWAGKTDITARTLSQMGA